MLWIYNIYCMLYTPHNTVYYILTVTSLYTILRICAPPTSWSSMWLSRDACLWRTSKRVGWRPLQTLRS